MMTASIGQSAQSPDQETEQKEWKNREETTKKNQIMDYYVSISIIISNSFQ